MTEIFEYTPDIAGIVSSIGKLGRQPRSHGRLFENGSYYSDHSEFANRFQGLVEAGEKDSAIGRVVFRGLVDQDVIGNVVKSDLKTNIEVALPVREFTGDQSWLVCIANNKPERKSILPQDYMIRKGDSKVEIVPPLESVKAAVGQGYSFIDKFSEGQVNELYFLWGDTFGWTQQEINNLRKRLDWNSFKNHSEKDIWFSAVIAGGKMISAAMAERLSIPGANGTKLSLVESTEWRASDHCQGNGAMTATLNTLNAQILSDLSYASDKLPLIFAECNFQVRADLAGKKAGFHIPERNIDGHLVPQILVQNVLIRDGSKIGDAKLRDFTFMYLSKDVIGKHYNATQVEEMKSIIAA